MNKAIQEIIIPVLREKDFSGTFPHFRRISDEYIDLLSFQFDKYGGGFVVEIAKCLSKEIESSNKVNAQYVNDKRQRLSPTMNKDYWFRYDQKMWFGNIYSKIANEIVLLIEHQAEAWWSDLNNVSQNVYGSI